MSESAGKELESTDLQAVDPLSHLARLHMTAVRLYAVVKGIGDEDGDATEQLLGVIRRTALASAGLDMALIAVAGAQGVGKTTLVKAIYGLDATWLEANRSVGEQRPVVIREAYDLEGGAPRGWIREVLEGDSSGELLRTRWVQPEEWKRAIRDPHSRGILLGLDVPPTFFETPGMGFVLLPGAEAVTGQKEAEWERIMRFALSTATAAVIVTDHTTLAGDVNQQLADRLLRILGDVPPVVVVNRVGAEDDQAEDLRRRVEEVYGVPADDSVFLGAGVEHRPQGIERLRMALVHAPLRRSDNSRARLEHISADLDELLVSAAKAARTQILLNRVIGGNQELYEDALDAYREARSQARRDVEEAVDRAVGSNLRLARQRTTDYLNSDDQAGLSGAVRRFGDWLSLRSGEASERHDATVVSHWNGLTTDPDGGLVVALDNAMDRAVSHGLNRALHSGTDASSRTGPRVDAADDALPAVPLDTDPRFSPAVHANLLFIAGGDEDSHLREEAFMQAVRVLPVMAAEVMRTSATLADAADRGPGHEAQAPNQDIVGQWSNSRRLILGGLGALLGVDVLVDGQVDSVPALAGAINTFLFGGAETAIATAVSTAAAAAVIGGAAGAVLIKHLNDEAKDRRAQSFQLLDGCADHTHEQLMKAFDEAADYLEERLVAQLNGYLKVDIAAARSLRAYALLREFEEVSIRTREAIALRLAVESR